MLSGVINDVESLTGVTKGLEGKLSEVHEWRSKGCQAFTAKNDCDDTMTTLERKITSVSSRPRSQRHQFQYQTDDISGDAGGDTGGDTDNCAEDNTTISVMAATLGHYYGVDRQTGRSNTGHNSSNDASVIFKATKKERTLATASASVL